MKIQPYAGTADEWWQANARSVNGIEMLEVLDYNGRMLRMEREGFDIHTTNRTKNREYRTEYLNHIREIAAAPDEVWLRQDRNAKANSKNMMDNLVMIKYYKGIALAVVAKIENGQLTLKTWYELRSRGVRQGLLLKTQ